MKCFPPKKQHLSLGITLLEVMVVVAIIAIVTMAALPTLNHANRNRRTQQAANELLNLFKAQQARAATMNMAMGVRIGGHQAMGMAFEGPACEHTGSGPDAIQNMRVLDLNQGVYKDTVQFLAADGSAADVFVCIRPDGRVYTDTGANLTPEAGFNAHLVRIVRTDLGTDVNHVALMIPFNGLFRLTNINP